MTEELGDLFEKKLKVEDNFHDDIIDDLGKDEEAKEENTSSEKHEKQQSYPQNDENEISTEYEHDEECKDPCTNNNYNRQQQLLELYDFPPSYNTKNLTLFLKDYQGDYNLKWIEDTSAVAIFKSAASARNALKYLHDPKIQIRWYEGDLSDELIASLDKSERQNLAKERPETSALVARRLVSNALGLGRQLRSPEMKEKIAQDNQKIEKARDRRREEREKQAAVDSVFDREDD